MSSTSHNPASSMNRRAFLGSSARTAASAAAGVVGLAHLEQVQAAARHEHSPVSLGFVGLRNQGRKLLEDFHALPGCRIAGLCDIDHNVLARATHVLAEPNDAETCTDLRRLLDRKDIDAIVVSTPDHHHAWMTAMACDAGKDVYLEVPVTHTLAEDETLDKIIGATSQIVQVGLTHRTGNHYLTAMQFLHAGGLGNVKFARAWACPHRQKLRSVNHTKLEANFATADSSWLGSAASCDLHPLDRHFNWRWKWDFGAGELGTWGVHLLDLAAWGLQVATPKRVTATGGCYHFQDGRETPDTLNVQYDFGNASLVWEHHQAGIRGLEGRSHGVAFYGERGVLILDRSGWKVYDGPRANDNAVKQDTNHALSFLHAIRSRTTPLASYQVARASNALCHWGNQAYREEKELIITG